MNFSSITSNAAQLRVGSDKRSDIPAARILEKLINR